MLYGNMRVQKPWVYFTANVFQVSSEVAKPIWMVEIIWNLSINQSAHKFTRFYACLISKLTLSLPLLLFYSLSFQRLIVIMRLKLSFIYWNQSRKKPIGKSTNITNHCEWKWYIEFVVHLIVTDMPTDTRKERERAVVGPLWSTWTFSINCSIEYWIAYGRLYDIQYQK